MQRMLGGKGNDEHACRTRARRYATKAHAAIDQRRKYTDDPYIVHPQAVMELVRSVPHTEEMLAAAWLHDTVEDTPTTLGDIDSHFGPKVAELVRMLTNVSHAEDGNRFERKTAIDATAPPRRRRPKPLSWRILSTTPARCWTTIATSPRPT